jgi:hypothetical protein
VERGVNPALADELAAMDDRDQSVRAGLAADGSLFDGYHPRMEAVHRANAARLRAIIDEYGWPGRTLAGERGADAAWRVAQHAVGEPAFMRRCRGLLAAAADVPRWHFAYIDDRVRTFEGRPQRYGTQLRDGPGGPEPYPLEDASRVEEWRREAGLPPLAEVLAAARANPPPGPRDAAAMEAAELAWRRAVGWIE